MALDDVIPNNEIVSPAPGVPTDQFIFEDISELEIPPELEVFDEGIDPEYEALLNQAAVVNNYAIPAIGNMNSPYPTKATNTYDPLAQQLPPNLNSSEGILRFMNDVSNLPAESPDKPRIADPIASGIKSSEFDRYYSHPNFGELGWHPYADNESYYNANSNWFDNSSRMMGQLGGLIGTGFKSNYRSWADWIGVGGSFDNYVSDKDLASATEFADAMAIGNSTESGSFMNNLILQSGYTIGIIGSIAVEELAIKLVQAGLAYAGGPAGLVADAGIETGRTGRRLSGIAKIGKAARAVGESYGNYFNVTRAYKASRDMLKNLRNVDNARGAFSAAKAGKAAGGFIAKIVAPETVSAFKRLKTAQNSAQNVSNFAKSTMMFGGFYRDIRSMNLAMSEAKMEAGMVYNDMISLGYSNKVFENQEAGLGDVTKEQMDDVIDKANKASFETNMWNAPLIYLTNQLVLGTAMGGFRTSLGRAMANQTHRGLRGIIKTKPLRDAAGKMSKDVLEDVGTSAKSVLKRLKATGIKGGLRTTGVGALRYFSANLGEGVQEIYQEAVAHGVKHYYEALLRDPLAGTVALNKASLASAVNSQLSEQGFETFMSGFLMGGLVQGPQKLVFEQGPLLYDRVFRKEKFAEYKANKTEYRKQALKVLNDAYNRQADKVTAIFDTSILNFLNQKQIDGKITLDELIDREIQKQYDQSLFDVVDAKDAAKLQQIFSVYQTGSQSLFRNQLKDILKLDDVELAQAFPSISTKEIKSGKLRERAQSMIDKIDEFGVLYEKNKNKFINPFDPKQFKQGSRDNLDEALRHASYEHVRMLYMFTQDGFIRAAERSESIYKRLASHPILKSISARDLTTILNKGSLEQEMNFLQDKISVLDNTKESKLIKTEKKERLEALKNIADILHNEKYATDTKGKGKGGFDRRSYNKLRKPLYDYLKLIAKHNNLKTFTVDYADEAQLDDVLKDIIDHHHLDNRQKVYHRSIEYLNNPKVFNEIQERTFEFQKAWQKNRIKHWEELIEKGIWTEEIQSFINALMKDNIVVDIDEFNAMTQGDTINPAYITRFYGPNGLINKVDDSELYEKAIVALETFKTIIGPVEEEIVEEEEVTEDAAETYKGLGGVTKDSNPVLFNALRAAWDRAALTASFTGTKPDDFQDWLRTTEAQNIVNAYKELKALWKKNVIDTISEEDFQKYFGTRTKEDILRADHNFLDWMGVQIENEEVIDIFKETNTSFAIFNSSHKDSAGIGETILDPSGERYPEIAGKINVIKIDTTNQDNEAVTIFTIRHANGQTIDPVILASAIGQNHDNFNSEKEAADAAIAIVGRLADSESFTFDGIEVRKGTVVTLKEDMELQVGYKKTTESLVSFKKGDKFIVIATPEEMKKGNYKSLFLLPEAKKDLINEPKKERNKHAIRIESNFSNNFDVDTQSYKVNVNNAAKLEQQEATMIIPHVEEGESKDSARERFQRIINSWPAGKEGLVTFEITKNPKGGQKSVRVFPGKDANPNIQFYTQPYTIAIKLTDSGMLAFGKLKDLKIPESGILGYVPNGDVSFLNDNGTAVNPLLITAELVNKTFKVAKAGVSEAQVDDIHKKFAIQNQIISLINEKIGDNNSITLTAEDFGENGITFEATLGQMDFATSPTLVTNLDYNDVNGFYVIVENNILPTGRSSTIKVAKKDGSDHSFAEQTQIEDLVRKAKNPGSNTNIYDQAVKGSRYQLIIKSPSGQWSRAEIKAKRLNKPEIEDLFKELKERSELTQKEGFTEVKSDESGETVRTYEQNYNAEFNQDFNQRFFIATQPGYQLQINLSRDGDVYFNVYDKKGEDKSNFFVPYDEFKDVDTDLTEYIIDKINSKIDGSGDVIVGQLAIREPLSETLNFTTDSIRGSFPRDAEAKEIAENTTTNLAPNIRKDKKMMISMSGIDIQESIQAAVNVQTSEAPAEKPVEPAEESSDEGNVISPEGLAAIKETKGVPEVETAIEVKRRLSAEKATIKAAQKEIEDDAAPEAILDDIPKWAELEEKLKDIDKKLRDANKIVSSDLSFEDVEDIDVFIEWTLGNLPDFFSVNDIRTLASNLKANGVRVGAFSIALRDIAGGQSLGGIIYTGAKSPFRYHEAFHGVFRMLLSTEQQTAYYAIAKKEIKSKLRSKKGYEISPGVFIKSWDKGLEMLKNSADVYENMSASELEKEFLEEYMADEFEKFKTDPKSTSTDSFIKSLFNKILALIRSIFRRYKQNELKSLYERIDSGKFKNSSIQINRFTESAALGVTVEANKVIYKKSEHETLYLNEDVAYNIMAGIAARVITMEGLNDDINLDMAKLVQESFDIFRRQYDPKLSKYQYKDIQKPEKRILRQINDAFNYEDGKEIMKQVLEFLELFDIKISMIDAAQDEHEEEYGLRNVSNYKLDASLIGGEKSLPSFLRKYIATTILVEKDMFGNDTLFNGEKVGTLADYGKVYAGFMKGISGLTDPVQILQQLYLFSQNNSNTHAVVNRMLNDLNLKWADVAVGDISNMTDVGLFMKIIKGFSNFRVEYLFIHRYGRGENKDVIAYTAANRDDANSQIEEWAQHWTLIRKRILDGNLEALQKLEKAKLAIDELVFYISKEHKGKTPIKDPVTGETKKIAFEDVELEEISKRLSKDIYEGSGLSMSPGYIRFTIAEKVLRDSRTTDQNIIVSRGLKSALPIQKEDITELQTRLLTEDDDGNAIPGVIFSNTEEGMYNRLRRIAFNNAPFDEGIGTTVFLNPNGDLVYPHQKPTLHLKRMAALNDIEGQGSNTDEDFELNPHLADDIILRSKAFKQMSAEGLHQIIRIAGTKESDAITQDEGGFVNEDTKSTDGSTYGDLTKKDFILALINSYVAGVNGKTGDVDSVEIKGKNENEIVALAPILIRVIEASNTGDLKMMPVIKSVIKSKLGTVEMTDEALEIFVSNVKKEFERIKKENNPNTATKELKIGYNATIAKVNNSGRKEPTKVSYGHKDGRAFAFNNTQSILEPSKSAKEDVDREIDLTIDEREKAAIVSGSAKYIVSAREKVVWREGQTKTVNLKGISPGKKKGSSVVSDPVVMKLKLISASVRVTSENQAEYARGLGRDIVKASNVPTETLKNKVTIGDVIYHASTKKIADWLKGETDMVVYEKVTSEEVISTEVTLNDKIDAIIKAEQKQAALLERVLGEATIKYYNSVKADGNNAEESDIAFINQQYENLPNEYKVASEEAAEESAEVVSESLNFKEILEAAINEKARLLNKGEITEKEYNNLTIDDALGDRSIDELYNFIRGRVNEEFDEFRKLMEESAITQSDLAHFIVRGIDNEGNNMTDVKVKQANDRLNLSNNPTFNLKQIFINDWLNTSAINKYIGGDETITLKNAIDKIKRAKDRNAAIVSAASTMAAPKWGIEKPMQEVTFFGFTEPTAVSSNATVNMKTGESISSETEMADAQAYGTSNAFLYTEYGFARMTDKFAEMLQKLKRGEKLSTAEYRYYIKKQQMINSKKLVYADGEVYGKMSVTYLFPELTSKKDEDGNYTIPKENMEKLHNMRIKMEAFEKNNDDGPNKTIAMAMPVSALKMLKKNITPHEDFFDNTTELGLDMAHLLDANNLGLQVINPSNKMIFTDPTQIKNLITGEQSDDTLVMIGGEPMTIKQVRDAYNKGVSDRLSQNYLNKRNLIFSFDLEYATSELQKSFDQGKVTADLLNYLEYAQVALKASGSAGSMLDFFSIDDLTGEQEWNLNNPLTKYKYEQLFLAFFNKGVMAEKLPGTSAALVSDFGFRVFRMVYSVDENGVPKRSKIIRETQFNEYYQDVDYYSIDDDDNFATDTIRGLKGAVEKSKGKGVLILDRLRSNVREYADILDEDSFTGTRYIESLMAAHHESVMDELVDSTRDIPESVRKMFGVRIPSQDNHSAVNVRIVDFLPTFYGSSIVSARELVEISGADFDIDKLYIHMKEFFMKEDKTFHEYGESYEDYIRYQNHLMNQVGSVLQSAQYKNKYRGVGSSKFTANDLKKAKEEGFNKDTYYALRTLSLPTTKEEFDIFTKDHRNPNVAYQNNKILDYKAALLTNDHVAEKKPLYRNSAGNITLDEFSGSVKNKRAVDKDGKELDQIAISYEPADIRVLNEVWDDMQEEFPELVETLAEDGIDADNFRGKTVGFSNNKEGERGIGAAVLPNLGMSLLTEYGVTIPSKIIDGRETNPLLRFNGKIYNNFGISREILENGTKGERKQYIISALITAMTDNAKERLAAKLHLSKNALAVVVNMVALGVPIKTAIYVVTNKGVRDLYYRASLAEQEGTFFRMGDEISAIKSAIIETHSAILDKLDKDVDPNELQKEYDLTVNQKLLAKSIKNPIPDITNNNKQKAFIESTIADGKVEEVIEALQREMAIMDQFHNAYRITQHTRNIGQVLSLTKGLGKDMIAVDNKIKAMDTLGLLMTDEEYRNLNPFDEPMMNVREIFLPNKKNPEESTWQSKMIEVALEFKSLLPSVFVSQTSAFQNIFSASLSNYKIYGNDDKNALSNDILSYLTIKAYLQHLDRESVSKNTAQNSLVYPSDQGAGTIVDVVDRIREMLTFSEDQFNYFIDTWAIPESSETMGNKKGISTLSANTFRKLRFREKNALQTSMLNIFGNPATSGEGLDILHYMMVKDGLQSKYKSLVSSASPRMMSEYLGVLDNVEQALKNPHESTFQDVFGQNVDQLISEFLLNYGAAKPNNTINSKTTGLLSTYDPNANVQISEKAFSKGQIENNPTTLFVIFDSWNPESDDQVHGLTNASGIAARSAMRSGATNVIAINTRSEAGEQGFYTKENETAAIRRLEKVFGEFNSERENYDDVIIQQYMDHKTIDGIKKNSKLFHDNLNAFVTSLGHSLRKPTTTKKTKSGKTKKVVDTKELTKIYRDPRQHAIYLDMSNSAAWTVEIDIEKTSEKGRYKSRRDGEGNIIPVTYRKFSPLNIDQKNNLNYITQGKWNVGELKTPNFRKIKFQNRAGAAVEEVLFPAIVRMKRGGKWHFFALTEFAGSTVANRDTLYTTDDLVPQGTYARYVEVKQKGSQFVTPIGWIFGDLISTEDLNEYVRVVNKLDEVREEVEGATYTVGGMTKIFLDGKWQWKHLIGKKKDVVTPNVDKSTADKDKLGSLKVELPSKDPESGSEKDIPSSEVDLFSTDSGIPSVVIDKIAHYVLNVMGDEKKQSLFKQKFYKKRKDNVGLVSYYEDEFKSQFDIRAEGRMNISNVTAGQIDVIIGVIGCK